MKRRFSCLVAQCPRQTNRLELMCLEHKNLLPWVEVPRPVVACSHIWLSGTIILLHEKAAIMSALPEPEEGRVYEVCKLCDAVRTIPKPVWSNEPSVARWARVA